MEITPLVCIGSLTLATSLPLLTLALFLLPKTKASKGKWTLLVLLPFFLSLSLLSQCPLEVPFFLQSNPPTTPTITANANLLPSSSSPAIAELAYLATISSSYTYFYVYDTITNQQTYYSSLTSSPTRGVTFSLDGTRVYIAAEQGIHIITTATYRVNTFITNTAPSVMALSPDGDFLYTVGTANNNVSIVDTNRIAIVGSVAVGAQPDGIVISPDGSRLYVANWGSNNVHVIEASSLTLVKVIPVGVRPTGIAISPDGTKVFVVNFLSDTISVIDTSKNEIASTIQIPLSADTHPQRVWITPKGDRLYVSIWNSNNIQVINAVSYVPSTVINVGRDTVGVAFTYSGGWAYSVSANRTIFVIDAVNDVVSRTIEGPGGFTGIAIAYVL